MNPGSVSNAIYWLRKEENCLINIKRSCWLLSELSEMASWGWRYALSNCVSKCVHGNSGKSIFWFCSVYWRLSHTVQLVLVYPCDRLKIYWQHCFKCEEKRRQSWCIEPLAKLWKFSIIRVIGHINSKWTNKFFINLECGKKSIKRMSHLFVIIVTIVIDNKETIFNISLSRKSPPATELCDLLKPPL